MQQRNRQWKCVSMWRRELETQIEARSAMAKLTIETYVFPTPWNRKCKNPLKHFFSFSHRTYRTLSHLLRKIRHNIESWRGGGKSEFCATFVFLLLLCKQQQHRNCRHSTLQRSINKLQNSNSLCCTLRPWPYVRATRERDSTKLIYSFVSVMNRNRFLHFSTRMEWPELNGWRWKIAVKLFFRFYPKKIESKRRERWKFRSISSELHLTEFLKFCLTPKKLESVSRVDEEGEKEPLQLERSEDN